MLMTTSTNRISISHSQLSKTNSIKTWRNNKEQMRRIQHDFTSLLSLLITQKYIICVKV